MATPQAVEVNPMQIIQEQLRKSKVKRLFQMAEKYGTIIHGFTAIDYLHYAIQNHGWESTAICGQKGSAKSNLMLQRGYAIYADWEQVDKRTITTRRQLKEALKVVEKDERIPWLGVDDIGKIFPGNLYQTDRRFYTELQRNWETARTLINCFDFTLTKKHKVAPFILEDITGDMLCYNRQGDVKSHYDYQRWMVLRSLKDPRRDVFKPIRVEEIPFPLIPEAIEADTKLREGQFLSSGKTYVGREFFVKAGLTGIPRPVFEKYWERRLALARDAFGRFCNMLDKQEQETDKMAGMGTGAEKPLASPEASAAAKLMLDARLKKRGF